MKKTPILVRMILFALIVSVSLATLFIWRERETLAAVDLSTIDITTMAADTTHNTLYVFTKGRTDEEGPLGILNSGIYRSDDAGRSWRRTGAGPQEDLRALVVDSVRDGTLFAGTSGGLGGDIKSLWRSTDEGKTWIDYGLPLPGNVDGLVPAIISMAIDPGQPDFLYVGTWGQGLYRFDLNGTGFELYGGVAFPDHYVKSIMPDPHGGLYLLTNESGLLHLAGESWRSFETLPDHAISLAIDPTDADTLYVGTVPVGAYRSTDRGQTWQPINQGLGLTPGLIVRVTALAVDAGDPNHLAAATAYDVGQQTAPGGIYESFDAGQSWTRLADADEVMNTLVIRGGRILVPTPNGLIQYGLPLTPASNWSFDHFLERINRLIGS